jgi:replication factor C large subunit
MSQLFTDKYFPNKIDEFIGNSEIVENSLKWANDWDKEKQKPLLFFGNSGTGKTTLAYLIAKEKNWQIYETNAADLRNKENIEKLMGAASQNSTLFSTKRLILIDEVDCLQSQDRGGASSIINILKTSNNPIILTANEIYSDKKLIGLRSTTQLMEFKKINYLSISKKLKEIAEIQGITHEEDAIKTLAKNSGGDYRGALLDLQSMGKKITLNDVLELSPRAKKEKVFNVMGTIFKGKTIKEINESVNNSEISQDLLIKWVEENIPRQYEKEDVSKAFDYFSRSDIFNARIYKRQHYGFLKYVFFLATSAVGLSKKNSYTGWKPFQFPNLLSELSLTSSKRKMKKECSKKIAKKTHCSENQAKKDLPIIQIYINENLKDFINYFEFNDEEVAYLLETKKISKKVTNLMAQAKEQKEKELLKKINLTNQTKLF